MLIVLMVVGLVLNTGTTSIRAAGTNPTVSDDNANSAGGTIALGNDFNGAGTGANNTAFGYGTLDLNTTGSQNTAVGVTALFHNNASYSTAVGWDALFINSTGVQNTAVGASALESNNGDNNTAMGANALSSNASGTQNTATGVGALYSNSIGSFNTATGLGALKSNVLGSNNTATGINALLKNTVSNNTADGANALLNNTSGSFNRATGMNALYSNSSGGFNTADGFFALNKNTTGSNNVAVGTNSLLNNGTGNYNAALGASALYSNAAGIDNTAVGPGALFHNTTANLNTGVGMRALFKDTTGGSNTALGMHALFNISTGSNNIGVGLNGGSNLTTGSGDIDIGNAGVAPEANTIRIGTQGTQTAAYIAGVFGSGVTGDAVVVSGTGQLGIVKSSARYKNDIRGMGEASARLLALRPVTFHYKEDAAHTRQYGLVAEEVARLYPELVSYGADGKVQSVHYISLVPMLLNELEKQTNQISRLNAKLAAEAEARVEFERRLAKLETMMAGVTASRNSRQYSLSRNVLSFRISPAPKYLIYCGFFVSRPVLEPGTL
jgi:hypothetical protein